MKKTNFIFSPKCWVFSFIYLTMRKKTNFHLLIPSFWHLTSTCIQSGILSHHHWAFSAQPVQNWYFDVRLELRSYVMEDMEHMKKSMSKKSDKQAESSYWIKFLHIIVHLFTHAGSNLSSSFCAKKDLVSWWEVPKRICAAPFLRNKKSGHVKSQLFWI